MAVDSYLTKKDVQMTDEKKIVLIEKLTDIPSDIFNKERGENPFLSLIESAIRDSWCRETSATPHLWENTNPSLGQCAVTALLIQDLVGGNIFKCTIPAFGSHYWNRLYQNYGQSVDIDLTRRQFPKGIVIEPDEESSRNTMLLSARAKKFNTSERYRLLRNRFLKKINKEVCRLVSGSWFEDTFRK